MLFPNAVNIYNLQANICLSVKNILSWFIILFLLGDQKWYLRIKEGQIGLILALIIILIAFKPHLKVCINYFISSGHHYW